MSDAATTNGAESGQPLGARKSPEPNTIFEVKQNVVPGATPIFDGDLNAVIGYQKAENDGWIYYFDVFGRQVGRMEKGLEKPLIDPIDLIFILGGVSRLLLTKAAPRLGARVMGAGVVKTVAAKSVPPSALQAMRKVFSRILPTSLKFTATTAARMATPGRHVPIHILELAVKHGKKVADPQGTKNAFLYTIQMFRNGKPYTLEVLLRQTDRTVLHFVYK